MLIDLAPVASQFVDLAVGTASLIAADVVRRFVRNRFMQDLLETVLNDALGKIQQAGDAEVTEAKALHPDINPVLAVGVRFALAHGQKAIAHFGLTPQDLSQRIEAKIGLAAIATNQAIAGNATPAAPHPLAPLPVYAPGTMSTDDLNAAELARHAAG